MRILLLDNYDSFTYNLYSYLIQYCPKVDVVRNDKISIEEVEAYDKIVISPGNGLPQGAGITCELISKYGATKSILGICLGHQAIGICYGASLKNLPEVLHGVKEYSNIINPNHYIFEDIPLRFECGRYHSWIIDRPTLPSCMEATAVDDNGEIMAVKHISYDVNGVQFHPESIMTQEGVKIIRNFVRKV